MKELNHNTLRYSGPAGDQVTIAVQAQTTKHLVEYTLDGATRNLKEGDDIEFQFVKKPGDKPIDLQLVMDYVPNGSYVVTILDVSNCSKGIASQNTCVHKWSGPQQQIKDFKFFAD